MVLTNHRQGQVILRKSIRYGLLSQDNNLKTYNRGIFASDNETLKVIEAYEKH
jgi:ATP-binding cassette subfamily F protein uup